MVSNHLSGKRVRKRTFFGSQFPINENVLDADRVRCWLRVARRVLNLIGIKNNDVSRHSDSNVTSIV